MTWTQVISSVILQAPGQTCLWATKSRIRASLLKMTALSLSILARLVGYEGDRINAPLLLLSCSFPLLMIYSWRTGPGLHLTRWKMRKYAPASSSVFAIFPYAAPEVPWIRNLSGPIMATHLNTVLSVSLASSYRVRDGAENVRQRCDGKCSRRCVNKFVWPFGNAVIQSYNGCFFSLYNKDVYCCSEFYVEDDIGYAKFCSEMFGSRLQGKYESLP